jgi:hypothetical protein
LTSSSQPSEGGPSTQEVEGDEATKAKKKKKVEEPKSQLTPSKDQGGERRKKKKHEEKKAEIAVKVKSAIKKSKVHRVLKIHVSSESDGNPSPQNEASKKDVVKQDQTTKTAEEEVDGQVILYHIQRPWSMTNQSLMRGSTIMRNQAKTPPMLRRMVTPLLTLRSKARRYVPLRSQLQIFITPFDLY